MKKIKIDSKTEYFAKKRIIQEAFKFFKEQSKEKIVNIESTFVSGSFNLIVNYHYLADFLGYDFAKEWQRLTEDRRLLNKSQIEYFFNYLELISEGIKKSLHKNAGKS